MKKITGRRTFVNKYTDLKSIHKKIVITDREIFVCKELANVLEIKDGERLRFILENRNEKS